VNLFFFWQGKPKQPSLAEGIAMTTSYFPSTESARLGWAIHYRDQDMLNAVKRINR
jgi:hypothetical protein